MNFKLGVISSFRANLDGCWGMVAHLSVWHQTTVFPKMFNCLFNQKLSCVVDSPFCWQSLLNTLLSPWCIIKLIHRWMHMTVRHTWRYLCGRDKRNIFFPRSSFVFLEEEWATATARSCNQSAEPSALCWDCGVVWERARHSRRSPPRHPSAASQQQIPE